MCYIFADARLGGDFMSRAEILEARPVARPISKMSAKGTARSAGSCGGSCGCDGCCSGSSSGCACDSCQVTPTVMRRKGPRLARK